MGKWITDLGRVGIIVIALVLAACGGGGSGESPPPQETPANSSYQLFGLDFSPYEGDQDPNLGAAVTYSQVERHMQIVAPYTQWVRTFGCTHGVEYAGRIAHSLQLKIAMGAWISNDLTANETELNRLIYEAKSGNVDLAIIGSEVLYRADLTPADLIAYIQRFRTEVPDVPVTTADVYTDLLENPDVIAECDRVLANYYPYWEGVDVDNAMAWLHARHQRVVAAAGGKDVIVSETGWPSDGDTIGDAVPTPENAAFFFLNFVSWARAEEVDYFYFVYKDEPWKAAYEGPQGAHWGLWDEAGVLKPGMQAVFDDQMITDNWSCGDIPGGAGTPAIELTEVPPIGSSDDLRGQVWHVLPNDYGVAVYIKVHGGWWTKPYWNNPVTAISCDGTWVCDITTGGNDPQATDVAAFLIPLTYTPPSASGTGVLPAGLYTNSVANIEETRN
jgi:exo-beta-1,3-glucanase (GH17 family)